MQLKVQECFMVTSSSGVETVAWSKSLREADLSLIRSRTIAAEVPGQVHHRYIGLEDMQVCLSQSYAWHSQPATYSVHSLVFSPPPDFNPFALCLQADTFLPLCPVTGPSIPGRELELPSPSPAECFSVLRNLLTPTHLAGLIQRAVLARGDRPLRFVPLHSAQVLTWFQALYACVPPSWRRNTFFATWMPAERRDERWLAGPAETEESWDPLKLSGGDNPSLYARALAEWILAGDFEAAAKLVDSVTGERNEAALQAVDLASFGPAVNRHERHETLLNLARELIKERSTTADA